MKKILTLLVITLLSFNISQAQKDDGSIKGKLIDTAAKAPITDATVSLLNAKDSSLATFTLSNKTGVFEFKALAKGDYKLIITHQGYAETKKLVSVTDANKTIDL